MYLESWRSVTYLFRPQYKRLRVQILTNVSSYMNEVEVTNIFKRYSDKTIERVIKSPAFLFSVAIWSHLAHSWSGLNYMCKVKYKTLGNRWIHYNYFSITTTSSFFKRFFFRVCFIYLGLYMHLSKFTWK